MEFKLYEPDGAVYRSRHQLVMVAFGATKTSLRSQLLPEMAGKSAGRL